MAKRKTKLEREAEQKAALRLRLEDMWCAAGGTKWNESDDDALAEDYPALSRWLWAIRIRLGVPRDDWTISTDVYDRYADMGKVVDMLWDRGCRADKPLESEAGRE